MKKKETQFIVTYNDLLEFQYNLAYIALMLTDYDGQNEFVNKALKNEYMDKFRRAIELLSDYMKSELLFFFSNSNNICDGIGQILLFYKINNNEFNSVNELYKAINDSEDMELISAVLRYFYYEATNKSIEENEDWDNLKKDYNKSYKLALSLEFENENRKRILLDFIENIGECKQRLALLLKVFYEKIYSGIFADNFKIVKPLIKVYEEELKSDKKAFFHKYMLCDSDIYGEKIFIHISYSRFSGGDFWAQSNKNEWIILGCYSNEIIGLNNEREKIFDFLKIIGEKKRIQIIEMLKNKPCYVDEIALKIGMTAPTASYHLTLLQSFDIVDFERYEHRFYYHLNNNMLITWLDKVKSYFER